MLAELHTTVPPKEDRGAHLYTAAAPMEGLAWVRAVTHSDGTNGGLGAAVPDSDLHAPIGSCQS
jgi:hypothetical protein